MTKSRHQLIGVYPYTDFPYHIGLRIPLTEIDRLIDIERWVQRRCGDLGSVYDKDTKWFISYAIEGMIIFGFRDRQTAFSFKMTFK